ncbi:hypothetical protein [Desulforamulus aquiferis]|uniref:Uncharacterized protein n=1 Tax=Desulforamulus aquiferis TaxID=1397668 RepID=A0AAW7Z8H4_9FIRM|nr:hypothetical protein [Desulforamulus aquiferis]MDO7786002.1 hypothetical protein [Desulforamulus aquiferis]RYD04704.1 hypothetical protein N752_12295 [Desulforamulus aquiferis]
MKSAELRFDFPVVNNTVTNPELEIVDEVTDWLEKEDSELANAFGFGICYIALFFFSAQILRFIFI